MSRYMLKNLVLCLLKTYSFPNKKKTLKLRKGPINKVRLETAVHVPGIFTIYFIIESRKIKNLVYFLQLTNIERDRLINHLTCPTETETPNNGVQMLRSIVHNMRQG